MDNYQPDVLISEEEITYRIKELGKAISNDFQGQELTVVCVLKGAFMFCADLIKEISLPLKLEFVSLSSYGDSTKSSGNVVMDLDISTAINDKNILIVEDILDTGHTLDFLIKSLMIRNPKSLKIASLLHKPARTKRNIEIDYLGFEIEDKFVIGYGLDYAGRYRELPYIGVLNAGN